MRKATIAIACMVALAVLMTVQSAAAQGKLQGVWTVTKVTISSPKPQTFIQTQPSFVIFTKNHYSATVVTGDKPRSDQPLEKATVAQKVALLENFEAYAGTYEVKGKTVTIRNVVSKDPSEMTPGGFTTVEIKIVGNTLIVTPKADQNGPIANPMTFELERVE